MADEEDYDLCPITLERFSPDLEDRHCPVVGECGHSFTKEGIEYWHGGRKNDEYHKRKSFVPCVYKCARKWTSKRGEEKQEQYKAFRPDRLVPNITLCKALSAIKLDSEGNAWEGMEYDFARCPQCLQNYSTVTANKGGNHHDLAPIVGICGHTLCATCIYDAHQQAMSMSNCTHLKKVECRECDEKGAFHSDRLVGNRSLVDALRYWTKRHPAKEAHQPEENSSKPLEDQDFRKLYEEKCREVKSLNNTVLEFEKRYATIAHQCKVGGDIAKVFEEAKAANGNTPSLKLPPNLPAVCAVAKSLFNPFSLELSPDSRTACEEAKRPIKPMATADSRKSKQDSSSSIRDGLSKDTEGAAKSGSHVSSPDVVKEAHKVPQGCKQQGAISKHREGSNAATAIDVDSTLVEAQVKVPQQMDYLKQQREYLNARRYIDQVQHEFRTHPLVFQEFLGILKTNTTSSVLETNRGIRRIIKLFERKRMLLFGFQHFMPIGYRLIPVEDKIGEEGPREFLDSNKTRVFYF